MNFRVGIATTEQEREAVYRLRYEVYVEQQGLFAEQADHDRRELRDDDDDHGSLILAQVSGETMGSVRIIVGRGNPFSEENRETFDTRRFEPVVSEAEMMIVSRLVVTPEHRGSIIPLQLMIACARFGVANELELAFCDCEPHLIGLYQRLGFHSYRSLYNHKQNGLLVPMVIVGADRDHFENVQTPLLHELRGWKGDRAKAERIRRLITRTKPVVASETEDPESYWGEIMSWLAGGPHKTPSIFAGLTRDEMKLLIEKSHLLECVSGDALIRDGQSSRTMFVVLSGTLEVREGKRVVGIAQTGDIVGEVAFLMSTRRMADVFAVTDDVRLLSLNESNLKNLIETDAQIAAKVLLAMSKGLCEKLVERSARGRAHRGAPLPATT